MRFVVKHGGETKVDLPIKELGDEAPLYDRPHVATPKAAILDVAIIVPPMSNAAALLMLMGTPDLCSKRWVWEQYDHLILSNTVIAPGGDAAVVRLGEGPKGLALTTDVTARYCAADPYEGGKQAVAEAWRNLVATGAKPLAVTDNLNFGNPEKPEIMGQFVGCLEGIGDACRALDFPIVSGNVSLYNETRGSGILPTPAIGGVGLVADVSKAVGIAPRAGDVLLLLGATTGWLGRSLYLRHICGRNEGAPPPVDLAAERQVGEQVRHLIDAGTAHAVHDISDGGLAIALTEMALASGVGVDVASLPSGPAHAVLFGEDQGRYLVAVAPDRADAIHDALRLGVVGGDALKLPGETPIPLAALRDVFETALPDYMAGAMPPGFAA